MVVDAMDLFHARTVDAFALVSSDADFTPLVLRLVAGGARVHGFGEAKAPAPFVSACTRFTVVQGSRGARAAGHRRAVPRSRRPAGTTAGPGSAPSARGCAIRRSRPAGARPPPAQRPGRGDRPLRAQARGSERADPGRARRGDGGDLALRCPGPPRPGEPVLGRKDFAPDEIRRAREAADRDPAVTSPTPGRRPRWRTSSSPTRCWPSTGASCTGSARWRARTARPLNEVELIVAALVEGDGRFATTTVIRYAPERSRPGPAAR